MRTGEVAVLLGMTGDQMAAAVDRAVQQGWMLRAVAPPKAGAYRSWADRDVQAFGMLRQLRTDGHFSDDVVRKMLASARDVLEQTSPLPTHVLVGPTGVRVFWSKADAAVAVGELGSGSWFLMVAAPLAVVAS